MGRWSRNKGAGWERLVATDLKQIFPEARRGLGQARSAKEVSDVEGTPWWVECKRGKRVSIRAALAQARAATDGRPLLIVVREDIDPKERARTAQDGPDARAVACMPWHSFVELLALAYGHREAITTTADHATRPA
jgi:hypothetical protein